MPEDPTSRPGQPDPAPSSEPAPSAPSAAPALTSVSAGASAAQPQPVVVRVEQPKQPRGLMIALIVLLSLTILALLFGGCVAVSTVAGGAALLGGDTSAYSTSVGVTSSRSAVAVYHMTGDIAGTSGITPEDVRAALKEAEDDPSVKAIVLRVESGGGEAAASSEIASYIAACEKPVVVSVGGICASGAYFAASQADWIVTTDIAEIGAIGTYVSAIDASELLETLGINVQTIKSSDMKDMGSYSRALTDEETELLQQEVEEITQVFIERVAEGRGVEVSEVETWANGTTYLGTTALEMGMVDEVGTYDDALAKAAELGGIEGGSYSVVSLDADGSLDELEDLLSLVG